MATFNPLWLPEMGASQSNKPNVKKASFGDGYEQRAANGININPENWSLSFKRNNDFIDAIDAFLSARNGVESFWWTTPKGKTIAVVCEDWDMTISSVDWQSISTTFRQVFEKPLP